MSLHGSGAMDIVNRVNITIFLLIFLFPMEAQLQLRILVGGITKGYAFKTCSNTGRRGPTQHQCNSAYKSTNVSVTVIDKGLLAGVQVWRVPQNNTYSITALAASGGTGVLNSEPSSGAFVTAKFNLTEGEEIYMLVGQTGQSACSPTNLKNNQTANVCQHGIKGENHDGYGGGGGGGGTFVFKKNATTGELIPLVIAGGGGGMSFQMGHNAIRANGGLTQCGSGNSAVTTKNGPGGGGGWNGLQIGGVYQSAGLALLEGGVGGQPCAKAQEMYNWDISGGFGGGGGGCRAGGGGGGYTGGNASVDDSSDHNGQGGSSYISELAQEPLYEPGNNNREGEVEIALVLPCDCEFMCIYSDYKNKLFKCYCPANHVLAEDNLHCIGPDSLRVKDEETLPIAALVAIVLACIVLLLIGTAVVVCIIHQRHKKRLKAVGLEMLSQADYQLDRLRSVVQGSGGITEYNPNYDFGGPKCTIQDLREIPRDNLTLVRPLGQGAFGEVYQGYLSNVPRESGDLPVAVKTLPALCTDQAEMDFHMEALIMSKFNHRNIVRFLGVCFEKHPRFIVLELLEGGDLKTFLRASRPKPGHPTRLTMIDLVHLALNVANGCQYLEENHFIHRDIAARNCLLTTKGPNREAKIADFGMARDIYRADYYRKGGKAMLPVKWMPPEAFLDGIFTSKTDVWSFGILLWEVFSLGYMPYPGRGNQEVMQFVTTGGRLEPPQNCPQPVYNIMTSCWHGIQERRPAFAAIINRLQHCLQDSEVLHSPLPVFHRPPSIEREPVVMRPRDPDRVVLTVEPPRKYLEPDSPSSMDQLIGPQSPDIDITSNRRPLVSDNKELLDRLLSVEEEDPDTVEQNVHGQARGQYKRVFDYDNTISEEATGNSTQLNGGVSGCSTTTVQHHPSQQQKAEEECLEGAVGGSMLADSGAFDDSGKSSMENVSSQADDVSRTSTGPSSTSAPSSPTGSHGNSIARSRPSPKNPVTRHSSSLPLSKVPLVKYKPSNDKPSSNSLTRASIPVQAKSPADGPTKANCVIEPFDPWEPRIINAPSAASYENVPLGISTSKNNSKSLNTHSDRSGTISSSTGGDGYPIYDSKDKCKESSGDSGVVVDLQGNSSLHKRQGSKSGAAL